MPIENPTRPAAVAEAEPAEEPLEPLLISQGFFVLPPNQTSPLAKAPELSFPNKTAPAFSSFFIITAFDFISVSYTHLTLPTICSV